ncbi:MAG: chromate transporter [Clostridiales bacterium]|nr:chromate transporter [Clostridiales bacterium]
MMVYLELIWSYLKIGLFGFGGGYAMLTLIESLVVKHAGSPWWGIDGQTFTDIVAISQMTPGPIGINSATYIGYVVPGNAGLVSPWWGILGSLVCTLAVVLPPFILVMYLSHFISRHKDSAIIKGVLWGLRPVVVGLIASAALLLMNGANFGTDPVEVTVSVLICLVAFLMVRYTKIHPIVVIVLSGLIGFILYYIFQIS